MAISYAGLTVHGVHGQRQRGTASSRVCGTTRRGYQLRHTFVSVNYLAVGLLHCNDAVRVLYIPRACTLYHRRLISPTGTCHCHVSGSSSAV